MPLSIRLLIPLLLAAAVSIVSAFRLTLYALRNVPENSNGLRRSTYVGLAKLPPSMPRQLLAVSVAIPGPLVRCRSMLTTPAAMTRCPLFVVTRLVRQVPACEMLRKTMLLLPTLS